MILAAPVNKLIPLSTVDGPGARTAVFLQGCNIACAYCHNPETQRLCTGCGDCVEKCPAQALTQNGVTVKWQEERCIECDRCIQLCSHNASPKIKLMTPEQVMIKVRESIPFVRGITVSGGECMLYPEFLTQLFVMAKKEGLTCLVDSNGTVDLSVYPRLMEATDGFMLDVKAWSPSVYTTLTKGESNAIVKKNLAFLAEKKQLEEIRVTCLEEMDAEAVICGIAAILGSKSAHIRLKLIAFRNYGVRGRLQAAESPSKERMMELETLAIRQGFRKIVVV